MQQFDNYSYFRLKYSCKKVNILISECLTCWCQYTPRKSGVSRRFSFFINRHGTKYSCVNISISFSFASLTSTSSLTLFLAWSWSKTLQTKFTQIEKILVRQSFIYFSWKQNSSAFRQFDLFSQFMSILPLSDGSAWHFFVM